MQVYDGKQFMCPKQRTSQQPTIMNHPIRQHNDGSDMQVFCNSRIIFTNYSNTKTAEQSSKVNC